MGYHPQAVLVRKKAAGVARDKNPLMFAGRASRGTMSAFAKTLKIESKKSNDSGAVSDPR